MPFLETLQADVHHAQKGWGISGLCLELGEYSEQVARYLETFSQDAVTVLLSDDLRQDTHRCFGSIAVPGCTRGGKFWGVKGAQCLRRAARTVGEVCNSKRHGQGAGEALRPCGFTGMDPRHRTPYKRGTIPPMSSEARVFLEEYYRADMRRLESLLGRRLPWRWLNA